MELPSFSKLNKYFKSNQPTSYQYKVSVLADSSSQFFVKALKGYGIKESIHLDIYEADFDQISMEVLNSSSMFHEKEKDYVIILKSTEKLLSGFQKLDLSQKETFALDQIAYFENLLHNIPSDAKIVLNTFPRLIDNVFGNFSSSVKSSFGYQLSQLNFEIKNLALSNRNVFVCDIEALQSLTGINNRIDYKFYIKSKIAYSLNFLPILAKNYIDIVKAAEGIRLGKCLILDLDNTMWGGVIGDDGMEGIELGNLGIGNAFTALQLWAKELKNRGIILCVCSKNTEHIAQEPFEKHPDMVLRPEDISVFVANWENKADNIRYIQSVLNIGFDSMVFLDDNPFERNLVRQELSQVCVPELPEDPTEYVNYLRGLNLFETASFSSEDSNRTKRYQDEASRMKDKRQFNSIDGYLESLQMNAEMEAFSSFSVPRIAQLTQRSNQFNLRTIRYNEENINEIMKDPAMVTYQIKLGDKHGAYGLISLIIGKREEDSLFIDTWIMSCRVLKRGVEKFVLNELVERCKKEQVNRIIGEWIETKKSILVKDHYKELGFEASEGLWHLDVNTYEPQKHYIAKLEKELK